jgi:hypothetical protein
MLKGSELDCSNPTSEPLQGFGVEEQAGSTPGKGCADATFTLKTALQTLHEHNQESWVLFVDLVKVYDTVNREMLWKILRILGVPDNLIEVLQKLYTDVTINLRRNWNSFSPQVESSKATTLHQSSSYLSFTQYPTRSTRNGNSKPLTSDGSRTL